MTWVLIVETIHGTHVITLTRDEADALEALGEAQAAIGKTGVVRICDRLTLKAEDITAAKIEHRYVS
jgi:hypothetical protein